MVICVSCYTMWSDFTCMNVHVIYNYYIIYFYWYLFHFILISPLQPNSTQLDQLSLLENFHLTIKYYYIFPSLHHFFFNNIHLSSSFIHNMFFKFAGSFFLPLASLYSSFSSSLFLTLSFNSSLFPNLILLTVLFATLDKLSQVFCYSLNSIFFIDIISFTSSTNHHVFLFSGILPLLSWFT